MSILIFYPLATIVIGLSAGVILAPNPVHSAVLLVAAMLGVAGLFLCLGSEMLAILQVLIYAGAIMVLFLFIVMTVDTRREEVQGRLAQIARPIGLLLSGCLGALLLMVAVSFSERGNDTDEWYASAASLGKTFLNEYALPFEIITLVLIAAMVGIAIMSRERLFDRPRANQIKELPTGGKASGGITS
ncbi:NADH-quinone oxidoreductase subunit J [bacterium]|nr:NADH-quinone oxidoreductase subunit J [bacterium]